MKTKRKKSNVNNKRLLLLLAFLILIILGSVFYVTQTNFSYKSSALERSSISSTGSSTFSSQMQKIINNCIQLTQKDNDNKRIGVGTLGCQDLKASEGLGKGWIQKDNGTSINGQKYYCCLNNNYTDLTQACSQFFNGKFTSRGDSDGHSKYLTNLYGGVWGISYHAETQGIKNGLFHCYIKGATFTPTRTQPTITPTNTTLTNQQTQKLTNDCMQLTKQDNYNKGISISTVLGCQDLKTIDNRTWTQKGNGTLVSGRKYYCCLSKKYEDIAKACKDVFNGIFTSKGKPYPDWGISYYAETQGVVYGSFHCYVKGKTK